MYITLAGDLGDFKPIGGRGKGNLRGGLLEDDAGLLGVGTGPLGGNLPVKGPFRATFL